MSTTRTAKTARMIGLVATTALTGLTLTSCAGKVAPSAAMSAAEARVAMAKGKTDKAVDRAQEAVLASPRDAGNRALLATAYIDAGRFQSAATAFADAMQLGDTSSRTVLGYALMQIAAGDSRSALTTLDKYRRNLDPIDYGLALSLAGEPRHGVEVLGDALRNGYNTPKLRQNLAYSFALMGDWHTARIIASQDLGPDKLGDRLGEWAVLAAPGMEQRRVASLLGVTARTDPGEPAELALANFPSTPMLAAEAAAQKKTVPVPVAAHTPTLASNTELPAIQPSAEPQRIAAPQSAAEHSDTASVRLAVATPQPRKAGRHFVHKEVVQPIARPAVAIAATHPESEPVELAKAKASKKFVEAFVRKQGNYRVQLGSYLSMDDAQWAWKNFQRRHPEIKGSDKIITKAVVKGTTYFRVAAGGLARSSANGLCSLVKNKGGDCFAYSGARTLPGTVEDSPQMASR